MPHDLIEIESDRANPFLKTFRRLRSFAERMVNRLCRAMERWLDDEIPVGGQR